MERKLVLKWVYQILASLYKGTRWLGVGGALLGCLAVFLYGYHVYVPMSWLSGGMPIQKQVLVPFGATASVVSRQLKQHDLIQSENWFKFYVRLCRLDKKICPGLYILYTNDSLHHIVKQISDRQFGKKIKVTIPEGLQLKEIAYILEKKQLIKAQDFLKYLEHAKPVFESRYSFLASIPTQTMEGYLFPNTYWFAKGEHPAYLVEAFLDQCHQQLIQEWRQSNSVIKHKLTFHQALVLASMVEKEARRSDEMPIIASVFFNRLRINMPLASDPTVIYAMGLSKKTTVTYRDLKTDSPYNTYKVFGLPPSPICSPGKQAFKAVLYPASTGYLFFVADGTGRHKFSNTYAEHLGYQNGRRIHDN